MPKTFYTDLDIENLVRSGVTQLAITDNVVLTDMAYEKAHRLGMQLENLQPENPPAAPVRPYITKLDGFPTGVSEVNTHLQQTGTADLRQRIQVAVQQKLGEKVDTALLDAIITRVINSTGVK